MYPPKTLSVVVTIFVLLSGLTAASQVNAKRSVGSAIVPLDPAPVEVPDKLSEQQAYRSVVSAFVIRGWRITEINRSSSYVDAEYPIRAHVGRVRANVEDGQISFEYRESENVDHGWIHKDDRHHREWFFKEKQSPSDTEAVHRNYLSWVNKVARTLEGQFLLETME